MKNKLLVFAVLFISSFTLFGQGKGNISNGIYPFASYIYPCDEPVFIEGVFHEIFDVQSTPSGVFKLRYHINAKGKGVGDWTGAKYEWNDAINETLHLAAGETYSGHQRWRIIGQGGASDFYLNVSIHLTINANGQVTVDYGDFEAECK